ncbi:multidrug effflux MFS transporter [Spirobacillus cienkowskii]
MDNKSSNHKIIFIVVLFLVPISQSAIDIYSPSLPEISRSLATKDSYVQLTVSLYLLSLGLGQYFYGILADSIGRKKSLLFGLLLFTVSSFFCYFANHIFILIISRFFQGLGAASIAVLSKTISVDLYKGHDLVKASAWIGLIWGVAPIVAPVVGGYLDHFAGWRAPFFALCVYGIISCFLTAFFVTETYPNYKKVNIKNFFVTSLEVTKNKDFLGSTLIVATTNLGLFIFTLMAPFLIQNVFSKSQVFFGYMALFVGVIYILGAFLTRFAIKFFEGEKIIRFVSKILLLLGVLMVIAAYIYPNSIFILMFTSSVFAFASGFLYPFLVARMFAPFQNMAGIVSATYGIISYVFSGIISILLSGMKIESLMQVAIAYCFVGLITYLAMAKMFASKFKKSNQTTH